MPIILLNNSNTILTFRLRVPTLFLWILLISLLRLSSSCQASGEVSPLFGNNPLINESYSHNNEPKHKNGPEVLTNYESSYFSLFPFPDNDQYIYFYGQLNAAIFDNTNHKDILQFTLSSQILSRYSAILPYGVVYTDMFMIKVVVK